MWSSIPLELKPLALMYKINIEVFPKGEEIINQRSEGIDDKKNREVTETHSERSLQMFLISTVKFRYVL